MTMFLVNSHTVCLSVVKMSLGTQSISDIVSPTPVGRSLTLPNFLGSDSLLGKPTGVSSQNSSPQTDLAVKNEPEHTQLSILLASDPLVLKSDIQEYQTVRLVKASKRVVAAWKPTTKINKVPGKLTKSPEKVKSLPDGLSAQFLRCRKTGQE